MHGRVIPRRGDLGGGYMENNLAPEGGQTVLYASWVYEYQVDEHRSLYSVESSIALH